MPGIFASGSVGISGGFFPGGLTNGGVGAGAPTGKYNLLQNGGTADGVADNAGALATLCATIGATVGTIYLPAGMYRVRANVTVPANITLEAAAGAVLSMDAGVTLTLNGPVVVSLCRVFAGVGIVVFGQGRLEAFRPQYWGATGNGVTDDTAAFVACKVSMVASSAHSMALSPGAYKVSGFDVSNMVITGSSRFDTSIVGSGDLLTNAQLFRMEHLTIINTGARGNLVSLLGSSATAVQRSAFKDIEFGTAARHVYCQLIAVDWWFEDCRFNDADIRSRDFDYANAYREVGCYTWFNVEGLRIQRGENIKLDGVFEYNTGFGVNFQVSDVGVGLYDVEIANYFESNGTTTLNGDVNIETTGAARIRNVFFRSASFAVSQAATNVRAVQGGGGNIQSLVFDNCVTDAATGLIGAGLAPQTRNCIYISTGADPADAQRLDTAVTIKGGVVNGTVTFNGDVSGNVGTVRANQEGGAGPISFDASTLPDGVYIITASIQFGGPGANACQSAIWIFQKRVGNANIWRALLASDAPGNNDGNITLTGDTVTCNWGGARNGSINTTQLVR